MKTLFAFLFLVCGISSLEAQVLRRDTVTVNKTKFVFETVAKEGMLNAPDTAWNVYRIENATSQYLLTHVIYSFDADCNSEFEDHGSYEIKGDSIIFTTVFDVERDKNFGLPYQQKQVYIVKANGKMVLVSDQSEMEDGTWRNNIETD
jgi:hypothetical protein